MQITDFVVWNLKKNEKNCQRVVVGKDRIQAEP